MKSGNLNFLEHSGPLQACKGTDLHLIIISSSIPVMGKLFKEGAKGKEKNFRRANIIY